MPRGGLTREVGRTAGGRALALALVVALLPPLAPGGEASSADAAADPTADAVPALLARRCLECHGGDDPQGGLALDSPAALRRGGVSGPALVPGDPDASLLVRALRRGDPAAVPMPPDEPLPAGELAAVEAWVRAGAVWGGGEADDAPATGDAWSDPRNPVRRRFGGERLGLWSLRVPVRRPPPAAPADDSPSATIDAFIDAPLRAAGIAPAPPADRRTLLRRMHLDLTGLPPDPAEVEAFVADPAPDAVERACDRLLASPAYGEQLALLWLDAVRYADTNGFERDELRPLAWRYRDWCIDALNADLPYDRFLALQLAGDELAAREGDAPADAEAAAALVATGYLRLGPFDSTAPIFQEAERHRAESLADVVATTGAAMLGLSLACANCHDHKHDPVLQADFFRLRACFEGIEPREAAIDPAPRAAEIATHNAPLAAEAAAARVELDAARERHSAAREAGDAPRTDEAAARVAALEARIHEAERGLLAPARAEVTGEAAEIPATRILAQGNHRQPRGEVPPGVLSALDPRPLAVAAPPAGASSGRRLALARWLADPGNPLVARVIVNRVWQRLFGTGLVATPNDFGHRGAAPSHPELLDWLAVGLREDGWSLKRLHRAIVLSRAYARSSAADGGALAADPANRFLGRQTPRRPAAEGIRDALLAVGGLLGDQRGGPPRWPPVPDDIRAANPAILEYEKEGADGRPQGWYTEPLEATFVRAVYLVRKRSLPLPFLEPFDLPDTSAPCGRRAATTVAPQALALLNDEVVVAAARGLAGRVREHAGADRAAWPAAAVRLALQRPIDASEEAECRALLERHAAIHAARVGPEGAADAALEDLCRALLNTNEFLFVE